MDGVGATSERAGASPPTVGWPLLARTGLELDRLPHREGNAGTCLLSSLLPEAAMLWLQTSTSPSSLPLVWSLLMIDNILPFSALPCD